MYRFTRAWKKRKEKKKQRILHSPVGSLHRDGKIKSQNGKHDSNKSHRGTKEKNDTTSGEGRESPAEQEKINSERKRCLRTVCMPKVDGGKRGASSQTETRGKMQLSGGANKGGNMIVMESPWTLGSVAFFFSCFGLLAGIAL